jgi:amino acid adenylation domain-containing protein
VGPDVVVGICAERTLERAVGIVAVLKAGGAYASFDPAYPLEQLALAMADARVPVLLSERRLLERLPESAATVVCLDRDRLEGDASRPPAVAVHPENLAYVIFSSGSTGRPKGVAIPHQGLLNLVHWHHEVYGVTPEDLGTQVASPAFDVSVWELWPLLAGGARTVIPDEETRLSSSRMMRWWVEEGITLAFLPTPLADAILGEELPWDLDLPVRYLVVGGDRLHRAPRPGTSFQLSNIYGPAEHSVVTSMAIVPPAPRNAGRGPTIGRVIANTRVYVLDGYQQLVPVGVPGELYVSGAGLARGYIWRPELTAERFLPDPFGEPGARMYRTGDLVRWLPDGDLDFLGRIDHQVKLRGMRVELGEIEAVLSQHPDVREAVVLVLQGRLTAYVVGGRQVSPDEMRGFLERQLPSYMLPQDWVFLDALPLTSNGKVDRQALAHIEVRSTVPGEEYVAPRTALEEALAQVWAELLGLDRVGIRENFFDLGGHSLLAIQVLSRARRLFGVELGIRTLFESPTVESLAQAVERAAAERAAGPTLAPVTRDRELPLSFAQQRLWFLERLQPGTAAYNMPMAYRLRGRLAPAVLAAALSEIVRRHEALRTRFAEEADGPVQVIDPAGAFTLPQVDLGGLAEPERRREESRLLSEEALRPFDLARGPLLRTLLLRLEEGERVLMLAMHHIVSDGWSMEVLLRELGALYEAGLAGAASPLPELPVQYADFAVWQREWLRGEVLESQLAYWRERLTGHPPALELPTDRPRPAVQTFRGAAEAMRLGAELSERLRTLSRRSGTPLFMTALAGFLALLHRYTDQTDLLVGTPTAGRNRVELEGLIGFFVNTLVLRTETSGDLAFADLLGRARETALEAYAHGDLPFERLVEELAPQRSLSYSPLFQVIFALQTAAELPAIADLEIEELELSIDAAKFDLTLGLNETPEGIAGGVEYNRDLFDAATVRRLARHLRTLLAGVVERPEARLSELPLLSAAERSELLLEWNDTERGYPRTPLVHELFAAQARQRPEAVAVVMGDRRLTYGELEARSNRLAHSLRSLGVGPEVQVGICAERTPERVVGILAVLKAGGAYVSLDPAYPRERLAYLLEDAQVPVLLTEHRFLTRMPEAAATVISLDRDLVRLSGDEARPPEVDLGPESLAYVVYTSGSTGRPKGVAIPHQGLLNLVHWHQETYGVTPVDRGTQVASPAFDASVWELWPLLAAGAGAYIPDEETRLSASRMVRWWAEQGITLAFLPTPLAEAVLEEEIPGNLDLQIRALVIGGDRLHRTPRPEIPFRLVNHYGPSEYSVVTTAAPIPPAPRDADAVTSVPPIGRAISNTRIYVLDPYQQPVPQGVPGELYVSGIGLARGYLRRPDLTAEKFLPDPFGASWGEPGVRMYRTGDLVRWLPDGEIDFLGRSDHQVKLRGMRVELGEIEATLNQYPGVRETVVLVREDRPGDKRLTAYVVGGGKVWPSADELRLFLEERLPSYMMPQDWLFLGALPLTPNDKVDRRALPAPDRRADTSVAPRTPLEELLAGIFCQVFGLPAVGIFDDFFALGGHSLLATRVVSRVRSLLGIDLEIRTLFEEPTVEGLARRIEGQQYQAPWAAAPPLRPLPRGEVGRLPLSFAQQRLWFLDQMDPGSPLYNVPLAFRVEGRIDVAALAGSLAEIVRRHEALRTRFVKAGDEPVQVIMSPDEALGMALPLIDLSVLPPQARRHESERIAAEEVRRPFDLARGPLARFALARLAEEEHTLLISLHHIVSDGWSMGVLIREMGILYAGLSAGSTPRLPALPVQYVDYAVWQREWLRDEVLAREIDYWRGRLGDAPAVLDLPTDRPRPAVQSFRGGSVSQRFPGRLAARLDAVSRELGGTPFIVLMAAFQALLCRYTNQPEINVGTPIAGRTRTEIEGLIGFFVNTLVLRASLAGNPSFAELVGRVREAALEAHAHQDLPFEKLVEALETERSLSHSPLFQVMFLLQNEPLVFSLPGLRLSSFLPDRGTAKFDLLLAVGDQGNGLEGAIEYSADLFDGPTAARMLAQFETLLAGALEDGERRLWDLPLLTAAARAQLLVEWNDNMAPVPFLCQHERFATQARRVPDQVALTFGGEDLTYADAEARANRLAHLLKRLGVGPGVAVGVCLERSLTVPLAVLAIFKAGGVFLPLDPTYPEDRLAFMLADADAPVLLTQRKLLGLLPDFTGELLTLETLDADLEREPAHAPSSVVGPQDLAYVIYTSGSTGRPKGIAMNHGALANLVAFHLGRATGAEARTLQFSPLSFDVCFQEMFSTWGLGGTVVLISDDDRRDPVALLQVLERERIGRLFLPFVALNHLAEAAERLGARPSRLREVITAGEQLQASDAIVGWFRRMGDCTLENQYGPSELHVTTSLPLPRDPGDWTPLPPIGRSILNTRLYLLDAYGQPVPVGVPGEVFLTGAQMARGYLGRPDLTADRFVPNHLGDEPGDRLYRSGDLARYLPDGNLEFLGRVDLQVKVRGFRIEIGEIEAVLAEHPAVREAVVTAPEIGGLKRLIAYVVPVEGAPETAELKAFLEDRLPAYMVPSHFMVLNALPVAATGKVDRKALPVPEGQRQENEEFVPPRTPLEELVAEIWAEVLNVDRVGIHDNFWDLGGHSLLATKVLARVNESLGIELPLQSLFKAPTIAGFTTAIGESLLADELEPDLMEMKD